MSVNDTDTTLKYDEEEAHFKSNSCGGSFVPKIVNYGYSQALLQELKWVRSCLTSSRLNATV